MFSWLGSILSNSVVPMDCFRIKGPLLDFWTLKFELVGFDSLGVVDPGVEASDSTLASGSELFEIPQPHFCFLGMAAVTAPHEHGSVIG